MSGEAMSGDVAAQDMATAVKAEVRDVLRGPLQHLAEGHRELLVAQVALAAIKACFVHLQNPADLPKAKSPHDDGGVV